jgi:hypothetical protein
MLLKDIGKEVSTRVTNGKACDMVLVFFTIKMEECMKVNGGLTKCKEKANCIISQEN